MKKALTQTFHIPNSIKLKSVREEEGKTILCCETKKKEVTCIHCGGEVRKYDWRISRKRHTVVSGKPVLLEIKRRRFQCKECKKVFNEPLEGMTKSDLTDHFIQQIQEKAKGQDFSTVAREMGVMCSTVSKRVWELPVEEMKVPKKRP